MEDKAGEMSKMIRRRSEDGKSGKPDRVFVREPQ